MTTTSTGAPAPASSPAPSATDPSTSTDAHAVGRAPDPVDAPAADLRIGAALPGSVVDIVVPVYNEEVDLGPSVRRLRAHLDSAMPFPCTITIADNASTDGTWQVAETLVAGVRGVRAVRLPVKGRGRALKATWTSSESPVVAYMDVDLSTDLRALLPLVAPLVSGHSDIAIGSRLSRDSRVIRGPKREFTSRCYNLLLHGLLGVRFSDAQCGFKAMRTPVARRLLPYVEDGNWFFDTELLVLAQRAGLRIHEVPVDWVDDPVSTVDVVATAMEDLRGMARLGRALARGALPLAALRDEASAERILSGPTTRGMAGQLVRFGIIGVLSTLAYTLLYLVLRDPLGAQTANFVALVVTAVANTAANRRFTFGIRARRGMVRDQAGGLAAFALGWGLTSGSLVALQHLAGGTSRWVEVLVLFVANALATLIRFVTLRQLMHHHPVKG